MSTNIRKTGGRTELDALWARINFWMRALLTYPNVGDGTTDGKLRTNAAASFRVDGRLYTKASTDDLWDLSAETDTGAGEYKAYWLYVDASGTATIAAGTVAASAALALAALPAQSSTKCVFGVYVAGPSTDFNGAAGLAAQGTIHQGIPSGATGYVDHGELVAA